MSHAPETAVLLVNLGTPAAPTAAALRRYLGEFLSDRRVIEAPPVIWQPILRGVVLRTRPRRSAEAYEKIWLADGSPLLVYSRRLQAALHTHLGERCDRPVAVALGMRYGEPAIDHVLDQLLELGCRRLLVLPLYPQQSATTTASTFDAIARHFRTRRRLPALRFIDSYHAEPGYIEALAASVRSYWQRHGRPDRLLLSFHGIPEGYVAKGDPYAGQCRETAHLLAATLDLPDTAWQLTFQSRFGPTRWLEPYTDVTVRALGAQGLGRVDVLCPGFPADCLETLEEIAMQNAEFFRQAGGGALHYIPALNDDPAHVAALGTLLTRELAGW